MTKTWTRTEDDLFRELVEACVEPAQIAAKLNRDLDILKRRAYTIGLPLKWFKAPRAGGQLGVPAG